MIGGFSSPNSYLCTDNAIGLTNKPERYIATTPQLIGLSEPEIDQFTDSKDTFETACPKSRS